MKTFCQWIDRILGFFTNVAACIAGISILATAFIICYEIFARSVLKAPTVWAMEISTYLLILAGFLGMAYTMRKNGHITVDFLYAKFPKSVQRILDIFTSLIGLFALYVCMTESTNYMMMSLEMDIVSPSLLRVPLWIPQSFMVAGFVLLYLEMINHILQRIFCNGKEEIK